MVADVTYVPSCRVNFVLEAGPWTWKWKWKLVKIDVA